VDAALMPLAGLATMQLLYWVKAGLTRRGQDHQVAGSGWGIDTKD
jgi:hypothetical protein